MTWSAQYGTIDENGHYTAPTEERDDVVTAEVAGVSGTARVSVIGADHVLSLIHIFYVTAVKIHICILDTVRLSGYNIYSTNLEGKYV